MENRFGMEQVQAESGSEPHKPLIVVIYNRLERLFDMVSANYIAAQAIEGALVGSTPLTKDEPSTEKPVKAAAFQRVVSQIEKLIIMSNQTAEIQQHILTELGANFKSANQEEGRQAIR